MKKWKYRMHPGLPNKQRNETKAICEKQIGPYRKRFYDTGNYHHYDRGEFDIILKHEEDVAIFMMLFPQSIRLSMHDPRKTHKEADPFLAMFG